MNALAATEEQHKADVKSTSPAVTPQMRTVLDYLREYGEICDEDLQELLNIKKTRAYLLTRQMSEEGLIEIVGRGQTKKYRLR